MHVSAAARKQCMMIPDTGAHNVDYSDAVYLLCDGNGGCKAPTFNCGNGGPCTLSSTQACCNHVFQDPATYCTDKRTTSCLNDVGGNSETCKDTLDCPSNMLCCKVEGYGFRGVFCETSCTDPTNSIPVVEQACDPTRAGGGTCPTGQVCAYDGDNNSEGVCNFP
jgi:hypothetical protein